MQQGPSQDDGLLTYDEILQLNLQAELVILSACDTGRGEITGNGVIGLSRSFIAAGSPSVMSWSPCGQFLMPKQQLS